MAGTVRFFTDEHVAKSVVTGLRQRGIDVVSVPEARSRGATDREHLRWALAQRRVIVTHDADFLRLHADSQSHAGIVYASQRISVGDLIRGLTLIARVLDADAMHGHVEFL